MNKWNYSETSEPMLTKHEIVALEILRIIGDCGISGGQVSNAVTYADQLISECAEKAAEKEVTK